MRPTPVSGLAYAQGAIALCGSRLASAAVIVSAAEKMAAGEPGKGREGAKAGTKCRCE